MLLSLTHSKLGNLLVEPTHGNIIFFFVAIFPVFPFLPVFLLNVF